MSSGKERLLNFFGGPKNGPMNSGDFMASDSSGRNLQTSEGLRFHVDLRSEELKVYARVS